MNTSAKPAICSPPPDLFGAGAQFEHIPFRSKENIYRMPKELALPLSSTSVTPIKCPQSKPRLPGGVSVDSNSSDTGKRSCGNLKDLRDGDACGGGGVVVSGVDLGAIMDEVRGESVFERFMREESVVERIWGGVSETIEGETESL